MIFAVAVDNSIGFTKKEYYFKYKGCEFKYVPQYASKDTDDLLCKVDKGKSQGDMYELMTEFLSALAFDRDAKIIVHSGLCAHVDLPLNKVNIRYSQKRSVNVEETMSDFYYIPPLRTKDQIQLARLYRQANSANNIYLKVLFYWHILVYPSTDESAAVDFLDSLEHNLPTDITYMNDTLTAIISKKIFLTAGKPNPSLGNYIKDSIRHSIAHIVREENYGVSLKIDSWEQESHLTNIADFLQKAAKHRLTTNFNMHEAHDINIFSYTSLTE